MVVLVPPEPRPWNFLVVARSKATTDPEDADPRGRQRTLGWTLDWAGAVGWWLPRVGGA